MATGFCFLYNQIYCGEKDISSEISLNLYLGVKILAKYKEKIVISNLLIF